MPRKNYFLISFFLTAILQTAFIRSLQSQDRLMGVVANKMVQISPVDGALTPVADLSPAFPWLVYDLTYHPGRCLIYGIADILAQSKLVSIAMDGTTSVIGAITLPGNDVGIIESISYNEMDGQVYVSGRLNLPTGPGAYYSASVLRINVDDAVCTLVGEIQTASAVTDIDAITFHEDDFFILDSSSDPNASWARFYRFSPSAINSGTQLTQIYAVSDFTTATDVTTYNGEIYFTANRRLYKGDPDNFTPILVGQMHTPTDFNGALLQGTATVSSPVSNPVSLGPDLELCDGETASLEIPEQPGASVVWSNGVIGRVNEVAESGIYWVEVSQGACEPLRDTIAVNFTTGLPPIDLGPDLEVCVGDSVTLQVPDTPGASIIWNNGVLGAINTVTTSGAYAVAVVSGNCAPAIDEIVVNFVECTGSACIGKYYTPNVFSPNGDGINDRFRIYFDEFSCTPEFFSMQIFDRWGELVYEGSSLSGWDGTFRKKDAQAGVYAYMINIVLTGSGGVIFKKGDVTLIR